MSGNNLEIYEQAREVPQNAKRTIKGGRNAGKTSINPMWRLKKLTELFGACGFGWKYEVTKQWTEISTPETTAAFVNINLYVRHNGEWSEPIFGTGGSLFLGKEQKGLYTDDDCWKKALTDALSVACKALGFGADVYWEEGAAKYSVTDSAKSEAVICADCGREIVDMKRQNGSIASKDSIKSYSESKFGRCLCWDCQKNVKGEE